MQALVDSHCHLPLLEDFDGGVDAATALARARDAGVAACLCVSVDLEGHRRLLELTRAHARVWCTVGVHPNSQGGEEPDVARLVALAADPRVVAIGETGLDYFRSRGDLGWQHRRFRTHVRAAVALGKPLVVHSRDARDDVIAILREERAAAVGGVMHCFVDDWETASAALDLGFYISFSGIVTFRSAAALQDVARRVPLERLLVETDSPYLAPVPHRGHVNEPAYVRLVADHVAGLRGVATDTVARATSDNFYRLFNATST